MAEDLETIAQKMLLSVITLGFFSFISMAYSLFVIMAKPTEDSGRESRLRAFMLAGVIGLSGAILGLGTNMLSGAISLLNGMNIAVSGALKTVAQMRQSLPDAAMWGGIGAVTVLALIPMFVPDSARRMRLNKVMAGVGFAAALLLVLLTTGLYVAWRTLQSVAERGGV